MTSNQWAARTWLRLEAFYRAHFPTEEFEAHYARFGEVAFRPPASAGQLEHLEATTGLSLPDDLVALWRVHDGSPVPLFPWGAWLCGVDETERIWRDLAVLADEFNSELPPVPVEAGTHLDGAYHRRWLPVGSRDDLLFQLDFEPGPTGCTGQVLFLVNESEHIVVGRSLRDFIERWLGHLESGRVRYDPTYGHVVLPGPSDGDRALIALLSR